MGKLNGPWVNVLNHPQVKVIREKEAKHLQRTAQGQKQSLLMSGHLVNNVQSVAVSKAKFKPPTKEPGPSSSSSNTLPDLNASNCGNGGRGKVSQKQSEPASKSTKDNSDDSNELSGGHVGLPARPKKSMFQQE